MNVANHIEDDCGSVPIPLNARGVAEAVINRVCLLTPGPLSAAGGNGDMIVGALGYLWVIIGEEEGSEQ